MADESTAGSGDDHSTSYPIHPTSSSLLELCNLPPNATDDDRHRRLTTLEQWSHSHPAEMQHLLTSKECRDKKNGCLPLHWAAGTGFDEAVEFLLGDSEQQATLSLSADQKAFHPSTDRTPLHYAARNGHLSTCQFLIEKHGANSHPKCGRGSVTPLQLAVWQNRLDVVRYLVEKNALLGNNDVILERNGFACGLMHWIGLVPQSRWAGDAEENAELGKEGGGVLPLARYLHSLGVSYESTPQNSNTQGHTPLHKAAWGGNLPLIQYFRDEHGVYDNLQDSAGNYAADIAKMRGNDDVHRWLLEHGSWDRHESYRTLGLDVGATEEEVTRRYRELARRRHPDKRHRLGGDGRKTAEDEGGEKGLDDFIRIKEAYEHLIKEGGVGRQTNPKYAAAKLIEAQRQFDGRDRLDANNIDTGDQEDDDLFLARLAAVLSDYGDDGFPVSLIARRWNQIWPDRPFPTPDEYIIERKTNAGGDNTDAKESIKVVKKKTKLLKFLRWKCRGTQIQFRAVEGEILAFDTITTRMHTMSCTAKSEY